MLGGRIDFSEFAFNTTVIFVVSLISRGVLFAAADVSANAGMSFLAKLVGGLTSGGAITSAVVVAVIAGLITSFEIDLV